MPGKLTIFLPEALIWQKQVPGAVALMNASIRYDKIKTSTNKYRGYSVEGTILIDPQYVHLYEETDYLVILGENDDFIVKHLDKTVL